MAFEDKTLVCQDPQHDQQALDESGQPLPHEFTFTAGEQEFFTERGFTEPTRCPDCRHARKQERREQRSNRADRQMYPAVCANCGKETMVPFEPRLDKPVYCDDCFAQMRQSRQTAAA